VDFKISRYWQPDFILRITIYFPGIDDFKSPGTMDVVAI
jgi:hypothetical protein